ncbi:MAG: hypothetical protein JWQ23_2392 [Herminiimonas sp.]|nr:hypothetical protein [Herminiimonas sp.]
MPDALHVGLAGYLSRNRFSGDDEREDGALVLVIDDQYRVFCHPAQHGDLVFEARLMVLPDSGQQVYEVLRQAMQYAAGRLAQFADTLVLSRDESTLLLQQRISADATGSEFEESLENFLNAIATWRRSLFVL